VFALAAALAAIPKWLAGDPSAVPRQAQLVIASTCLSGDTVPAGAACVLEAFSPEHVLASFSSGADDGVVSLFADWSDPEWQGVKRFLPKDHAVSTVVLTEEPEIAVYALRAENRSCAVFPASLAELQPLVRIFQSFRGLATAYGLKV
jgi:hypothetical protein